MVINDAWFIQLKQFLREIQDHRDDVSIQKVIINKIFYTISQNISHIKLVPLVLNKCFYKIHYK